MPQLLQHDVKRLLLALAAVCPFSFVAPGAAWAQGLGATALSEEVAGFGVSGRVMMIGAHPDDEDTQLITWLARGRHVATAYLSLTRGDGGQNLIGNELGEALGVVRTEELLAARRVDGGVQYFTRAYDFGFSKSAEETFRHWPRDSLLRDVITAVRAFRPHVIVSVFSGTPRDGHGQHQAAGILARDAYDLAGDTARFPKAATAGIAPWAPLKFYRSVRRYNNPNPEREATISINVGEYNPVLGRSYAELAAESRSQHKSQGFGTLQRKGVVWDYLRLEASRVNRGTDARTEQSMFAGLDTTLARFKQGMPRRVLVLLDSLPAAFASTQAALNLRDPPAVVPQLARTVGLVSRLASEAASASIGAEHALDLFRYATIEKERVVKALRLAAGLAFETNAEREVVALGDTVGVTVSLYNRGRLPVSVLPAMVAGTDAVAEARVGTANKVAPDSQWTWRWSVRGDSLTRPWWLVKPRAGDLFTTRAHGDAENPRRDPATDVATLAMTRRGPAEALVSVVVAGQQLDLRVPVVHRYADPVAGEVHWPLAVVPAVSVTLDRAIEYVQANSNIDRAVQVHLRSADPRERRVRVSLALPDGLSADSATRTVTLRGYDARRTVSFRLRGRLSPGRHALRVVADSESERFATGYELIDYAHIRRQRVYREATLTLQAVDAALPPGLTVAYIPGVGDNVAPALEQLGVSLAVLDPEQLAGGQELSRFDVVVVGPRAYEASPALAANNVRLLDFVRRGGTMVVQYGQFEMTNPGTMPYPIGLTRPAERVTLEEAPVRLLHRDHPLLTTPNRITAEDFVGWLQERGLYMPATFDPQYTPLLGTADPGEPLNKGGLLVAPYGRGTYVYTTLSFFRQLPAGVPGAARLFVNLLAAGRSAGVAAEANK